MGLFGGKSILGKIAKGGLNLGSIGESLNDITGVSASARQQYQHQLALQKDAQDFSKWQMQNAHQTEVQDLKDAGLNPVLSAGASGGASAGVSMGSASAGTSGADPVSMIAGIINMSNSVKQTEAQVNKANAETGKIQIDAYKTLIDAGYTEASISKAEAERQLIYQQIENAKSSKALQDAETKLKEWEGRHPILTRVLPASGAVAGATIGAIAGGPIGAGIGYGIGHGFRKPNPIGFNR